MTTLKVHLLADNTIFVGEKQKNQNLIHSFYVSDGLSNLWEFLKKTQTEAQYFNQAFAYWILCSLGRCKEENNKYGILTRKLITFSKRLWNHIRKLAKKIAIRIKIFQSNHH